VLLAGGAGLVVDAGLNLIGVLSPGAVGLTAASAALGVKKSVEAGRAVRRVRRRRRSAMARTTELRDHFAATNFQSGADALDAAIALRRIDAIDDERLDQFITEVVNAYQGKLLAPSGNSGPVAAMTVGSPAPVP